jgi:hypothetical protein
MACSIKNKLWKCTENSEWSLGKYINWIELADRISQWNVAVGTLIFYKALSM